MSPQEDPDNTSTRPRRPNNDEDNPFISFRRQVDNQIGSLIGSLASLPSAIYRHGEDHGRGWQRRMDNRNGENYNRREDTPDASKHGNSANEDEGERPAHWADKLFGNLNSNEKAAKDMYEDFQREKQRWADELAKLEVEAQTIIEEVFGRPQKSTPERPEQRQIEGAGQANAQTLSSATDAAGEAWSRWLWGTPHERCSRTTAAETESHSEPSDAMTCPWRSKPAREDDETDDFAAVFMWRSPYSPVNLERHPRLGLYGTQWRDAFEDLLRAEHNEDLTTEKDWAKNENLDNASWADSMKERYQSRIPRAEMGWEDLLSGRFHRYLADAFLRDNSIFQSLEKEVADAEATAEPQSIGADEKDRARPNTEMDMYKRHFSNSSSASQSSSMTPEKKTDVLSTLTSTESTTQPDGTVTTRVTLNTRFADGRLEDSETVYTTKGKSNIVETQQTESPLTVTQQLEQKKQSRGKGWFWTN
ncbi:hypothetical protein K402DRAFT_173310 [Aulographum hederae CBS 113979]|uniref:Uncharacterized protein n=1 Tax=Aulographum hederae CBS 113979 TaxID=1176131 RepID=A0A6G1HDA7_9PEZI|nr:hypothetical protein K402DRAFT_173310 [Aulographum hederae CBS 113979]